MMIRFVTRFGFALGFLSLIALAGCPADSPAGGGGAAPSVVGAGGFPPTLLLSARPDGAKPLTQVRTGAKVGDEVVFEARVGGRVKPWVEGRAVMVVIDPALVPCSEMDMEDGCDTPWDYCCESTETLTTNTATVQVSGTGGRPLPLGLEGHGGLKALDRIVVTGVVTVKDEGAFAVDARGIFRQP
ncbi:MAG: hypothetical protein ACYTFT_02675 [Planctomycetota bacterium]|jgi:hypothetical protein